MGRIVFALAILWGCSSGDKAENPRPGIMRQTIRQIDGEEVIPLNNKTVYIHNVVNDTYAGELSFRMKIKLQNAFLSDGRLKVTQDKEEADVWFYTRIQHYSQTEPAFDALGRVVQTRLMLVISIRAITRPIAGSETDSDVLLERSLIRYDTDFYPNAPPFEVLFTAEERLLDGISQRAVFTFFKGWYSDLKTVHELNYNPEAPSEEELNRRLVIPKDISKEERDALLADWERRQKTPAAPVTTYDGTLKRTQTEVTP